MGLDPDRLARLPRWAQHEIERLTRNVEHWQKKATAGPADSDTFVSNGYHAPATPLGSGTTVAYFTGGRTEDSSDAWSHRFEARLDGDELIVTGGDGIIVQPWASNVIRVRHGR